jgi:hypothetical protein
VLGNDVESLIEKKSDNINNLELEYQKAKAL